MTKNKQCPRIVLIFIFCLCAYGMLPTDIILGDEARLDIEKAVWTNRIEDRNYEETFSNIAPVAPLYLWMHVKGSKGTLQRLLDDGKLPIHHQWFYHHPHIGVIYDDEPKMIDNIMIPAGNRDLVGKLEREISNRGFFDWSTWSMKENITPGTWVVKVFYANGDAVLCNSDKACEYKIKVE